MLDEGYISAVTELRLIMSYSDKDSGKIPASQTSNKYHSSAHLFSTLTLQFGL